MNWTEPLMPAVLYSIFVSVDTDAFKQIEPGILPISCSHGLSGLGLLSPHPQN